MAHLPQFNNLLLSHPFRLPPTPMVSGNLGNPLGHMESTKRAKNLPGVRSDLVLTAIKISAPELGSVSRHGPWRVDRVVNF